jgi:hypothetical protein
MGGEMSDKLEIDDTHPMVGVVRAACAVLDAKQLLALYRESVAEETVDASPVRVAVRKLVEEQVLQRMFPREDLSGEQRGR